MEGFKLLVALGADPHQIPEDMWSDSIKLPKSKVTSTDDLSERCTTELRNILAFNLNLSQRYLCYNAHKLGSPNTPSRRMTDGADHFSISKLLEAPFHLVGQSVTTTTVSKQILSHLILDTERPIALVFTRASGHGKTELAKSMGTLLEAAFIHVDCTEMKYETDIFGPRHPYIGCHAGSPLNNHLTSKDGERSIVFLYEFKKTGNEVRKAFLLPLDNVTYRDRRNGNIIDCRKTIWIFATNHTEDIIARFHKKRMLQTSTKKIPFSNLQSLLHNSFKRAMGAPLVGRLTSIVPFFPFTRGEQAVMAHGFLLRATRMLRAPLDRSQDKLIGALHVQTLEDRKLCTTLAEKAYDPELGARSLDRAVTDEVLVLLVNLYLDGNEPLERTARTHIALERYSVHIKSDIGRELEIVIAKEGGTRLRALEKVQEDLFKPREQWKLLSSGKFTIEESTANVEELWRDIEAEDKSYLFWLLEDVLANPRGK